MHRECFDELYLMFYFVRMWSLFLPYTVKPAASGSERHCLLGRDVISESPPHG